MGDIRLGGALTFKDDSKKGDIDKILEPFYALKANLDSSIMLAVAFSVVMLVISLLYLLNARQKEMMIRRALGEKKKRELLQFVFENTLIAFLMTSLAYLVNITLVSRVIEFMFAQSIKTQNNLQRIATGELGSYDELYELSRYNVVNISLNDYVLVLAVIFLIIICACFISFLFRKKENFREFLN